MREDTPHRWHFIGERGGEERRRGEEGREEEAGRDSDVEGEIEQLAHRLSAPGPAADADAADPGALKDRMLYFSDCIFPLNILLRVSSISVGE